MKRLPPVFCGLVCILFAVVPTTVQAQRTSTDYFTLGNQQFDQKDFEGAIRSYTECIRLAPQAGGCFTNRGNAYARSNKRELAIADYTEAIKLGAKAIHYTNRGNAYLALTKYDLAAADYSEAIKLEPKNPEHYDSRALVYRVLGKYDSAIADYNEAIKLNPNDSGLFEKRGWCYFQRDQNPESKKLAIADLTESIRLNAKNADAYQARGHVHVSLKQTEHAIADFSEAIRLVPNDANSYLSRGHSYCEQKKLDLALADEKKATDLGGKVLVSCTLLMNQEKLAAAKPTTTPTLDPGPTTAETVQSYLNQALRARGNKDYATAIEYQTKAIQLNGPNPYFYDWRADVYFEAGDLTNALADYTSAIKLFGETDTVTMSYNKRAEVHLKKGEVDLALADLNHAISLSQTNAYGYVVRASIYKRQGKLALAREDLQKALEINPNYKDAQVELEKLNK